MFNRILVPLDGSALAEKALAHAEQFARIFGSSIVLLQVLDPTSYHENPNPIDPLNWQIRKTEADLYMSGVAARLQKNLLGNQPKSKIEDKGDRSKKKITIEYSIREGKTAENIVNFAHSENIDLLIISTHGSGGISRWNISSVTQKVINLIYLPVLIVRAYDQLGINDVKVHYRHILLPIDSSRRAECALSAGIALAQGEISKGKDSRILKSSDGSSASESSPSKSKLILAAVIRPPELPLPEPYPAEIEQLSAQLLEVSRKTVSNYLNEMKDRYPVDCETRVVESNSVSTAIHALAGEEEDIDLVVLCAHGYTGQSTWPYGSVARNYIEHGTKTVLIIQDVSRSQVKPTTAELAANKTRGH